MRRILLAGLLSVVFLVPPAAAATLTVCANGCDYATIQGAINGAASGDTVLVSDGTYIENIDFSGKAIKTS